MPETVSIPVKWLKDLEGNKIYPRTHLNAVKDDNGNPISALVRKVQVTEEQMEQMIANRSWEAGVTYYSIEDE